MKLHRSFALAVGAVLAVSLTGCGGGSDSPDNNKPGTSAGSTKSGSTKPGKPESAGDARIAGWNAVSDDLNGLFTRIYTIPKRTGEPPANVAEVNEWVKYTYRDGVQLADFQQSGRRLCLSGPGDTYLTMTLADELKRTLGTGKCNYDDGDIVVVGTPKGKDDIVEKVTKGEDLAKQVPTLEKFVAVIRLGMASRP